MYDSMRHEVGLLVIGDEILSGRTADKNIHFLAKTLDENGYTLDQVRVIGDTRQRIISSVQEFSDVYTYVFTSGGIGGTHDDITFASVAMAMGRNIVRNAQAYHILDGYYKARGMPWTDTRRNMTMMPENCGLLRNSVSLAPGAVVDNVFVCAGIPKVFQCMVQDALVHYMQGGVSMYQRSVYLDGIGEGMVGDMVTQVAELYKDVRIGSYPHFTADGFSTEIVVRSCDRGALDRCFCALRSALDDMD